MDIWTYLTTRRSSKEERNRKLDRNWATVVALIPALLSGWLAFGPRVFSLFYVVTFSAFVADTVTAMAILKLGDRTWFRAGFACCGQAFLVHWLIAGFLITLCLPPDAPMWTAVIGGCIAGSMARLAERSLLPRLVSPSVVALAVLYAFPPSGMIRGKGPILAGRELISIEKIIHRENLDANAAVNLLSDDWLGRSITGSTVTEEEYREILDRRSAEVVKIDAVSKATPLTVARSSTKSSPAKGYRYTDGMFGFVPGTIGETNSIALICGIVILMLSSYVPLRIVLLAPVTLMICSLPFVFHVLPWSRGMSGGIDANAMLLQVFGGGIFLAMFFLNSTDYRPRSGFGQVIFALALGALIALGRGVTGADVTIFALLLLGVCWPLIDRWGIQFSGENVTLIEEIGEDELVEPSMQTSATSQVNLKSASQRLRPEQNLTQSQALRRALARRTDDTPKPEALGTTDMTFGDLSILHRRKPEEKKEEGSSEQEKEGSSEQETKDPVETDPEITDTFSNPHIEDDIDALKASADEDTAYAPSPVPKGMTIDDLVADKKKQDSSKKKKKKADPSAQIFDDSQDPPDTAPGE